MGGGREIAPRPASSKNVSQQRIPQAPRRLILLGACAISRKRLAGTGAAWEQTRMLNTLLGDCFEILRWYFARRTRSPPYRSQSAAGGLSPSSSQSVARHLTLLFAVGKITELYVPASLPWRSMRWVMYGKKTRIAIGGHLRIESNLYYFHVRSFLQTAITGFATCPPVTDN
jgi:hypothetical protein